MNIQDLIQNVLNMDFSSSTKNHETVNMNRQSFMNLLTMVNNGDIDLLKLEKFMKERHILSIQVG